MSNQELAKLIKEVKTAEAFLKDKIAKEKKSIKIRLIVGSVVTVLVFSYMFWLNRTLVDMVNPEGMRTIVVATVRTQAPQLVDMAKKELLANKKVIVDFLTKEGLDNLVVMLLREAEDGLNQMVAKISNETVLEMNEHFVEVLAKNDTKLHALLLDPQKLHLEEELVKAFDDDLQASMGDLNFDEDFNEPLAKKYKESLGQLNMINQELRRLAESDQLSRKEVLIVRFIKMWSGYMNDVGSPEPAPVPVPAPAK